MANISASRLVYVISYDSKLNEGQRIYLRTSPKRVGVADLQQARRFGSLKSARAEAEKLKLGNPRIERHEVKVMEDILATFPCVEEEETDVRSEED